MGSPNPTGTWTAGHWFRKPPLAPNTETYFNDALDLLDAWLTESPIKLGQSVPNSIAYDTLIDAVGTIGSTPAVIEIPSGTWPVPVDLTVPSNILLIHHPGSRIAVSSGATLTIQGPISAGPYQIFSLTGTGAIDLTASPTKRCYFQWWGAAPGTATSGTDISPYLLKAYQSLTDLNAASNANQHEIVVTNGFWWLNTNFTYVPPGGWTGNGVVYYPPHLVGEDEAGTAIVMNVGSTTDGICMGGLFNGNSQWIYGAWIKDLTILGAPGSCRHALNLECWNNHGGTENVSTMCGSSSSVAFLSSVENCSWDIRNGITATRYSIGSAAGLYNPNYAGTECAPVAGVGYDEGSGTHNYFKVHQTFTSGAVYALKLDSSVNCSVDAVDIEGCTGGEVGWNYAPSYGAIQLYSGGTTRIGQTFTLTNTTEIDNFVVWLNRGGSGSNPHGKITCNIYNTSSGPNSKIFTSSRQVNALDVDGLFYMFPTAKQSLAAGTYFIDIEFTGGDSNNYIYTTSGTPNGPASTCYTYSGAAWHAQTYGIYYAINARGAIWLTDGSKNINVKCQHMEANCQDFLIDQCTECEVNQGYGEMAITRSNHIKLSGTGTYFDIVSDPYSSVVIDSAKIYPGAADALRDSGDTVFNGFMFSSTYGTAQGVKGNNFANLMPNTLLDRWQTTMPDGGWALGSMTMVQAGTGKSDTTRHPLTPYCAKLTYASTSQTNWSFGNLTGELLNMCKGRWVCWSAFYMFPAGQTFFSPQNWAVELTVPAWAMNTAYNVGDAVSTPDGQAICVEAGTSGGTQPTWGHPWLLAYNTDGSVVWLNFTTNYNQIVDSAYSDGLWHRLAVTTYIPTNATAAKYNWQWYGQTPSGTTTAYVALSMLNFGRVPGMAPAPIALLPITQTQVVGNSHFDSDAYIPSDGTNSKLKGLWACVGDRCKNDGTVTALTTGNVETWGCTVAGINGSGSTWAIVTKVP